MELESQVSITTARNLVTQQFPRWSERPLKAIPGGAGNALFRLGDDLLVRLPLHRGTETAINVELRLLPWLADQLPLAIPLPVAAGTPNELFPRPWAIFTWLDGLALDGQANVDLTAAAVKLGQFVAALQDIKIAGAPPSPRPHPLQDGGRDVLCNIHEFSKDGTVDEALAMAVWESAAVGINHAPVMIHADLFPMNLLAVGRRLSAVIDFDLIGTGDAAVDMLPAWSMLAVETRQLFRLAACVDDETWMRGRAYALAGALGVLRKYRGTQYHLTATAQRMLKHTVADYQLSL